MRKYKYLFWDLDGTILNSFVGCSICFEKVFNHFNLDIAKNEYKQFIGPPLRTSFLRVLGGDKVLAEEAIKVYSDAYHDRDLSHDVLFEGIVQALKSIKAKGYIMNVATSKGQASARELLKVLGAYDLFDCVYGADYATGKVEKEEVLAEAIARSGADKELSLMIGDSMYDAYGAKHVGIDCLACTYGYGDIAEMKEIGIVAECDQVSKLVDFF